MVANESERVEAAWEARWRAWLTELLVINMQCLDQHEQINEIIDQMRRERVP
jgi:uncharacterized protein (DUF885 family)